MERPLRKQAEELLKQQNNSANSQSDDDLNKLVHELQVHQLELELQNEELHRTQLELQESQRKYFEYFHQAPISYLTIDRNGVIQEANLQSRMILTNDATRHLVGRPLISYLQSASHDTWKCHQEMIFDQQVKHTCELMVKQMELGQQRYVFLQSKPMQKDDELLCWTAMTDITEQKTLEIALRRSQLRLKEAQNTAQIANWEYHLETEECYWSDELFRLLGYEPNTIIPSFMVLLNHVTDTDVKHVNHTIQDAIAGIKSINIDFQYHRIDGEVRSAHLASSPRTSQTDGQLVIAGTFQDITERKTLETEVIQLEVEKERTNVLSQFISDASHEFRTPLSIIHSTCQMMQWEIPKQEVDENHPEVILEQVTRIEDLLVDLLLMSRLDAGTPLQLRIADINYIVKLAVDGMYSQIQRKRITLHTDLFDEVYLLKADDDLLGRAFAKVLHNAIRYSPPHSEILVTTRYADSWIEIVVQDEGSGMNHETLTHATERFFRIDTAHATAGFGLGLPIAKKVIEAHGGKFAIESQAGQGTTICMQLPMKQHQ